MRAALVVPGTWSVGTCVAQRTKGQTRVYLGRVGREPLLIPESPPNCRFVDGRWFAYWENILFPLELP